MLGFEIDDAIALLRMDDRLLHGDHISRAIGRIAGQVVVEWICEL